MTTELCSFLHIDFYTLTEELNFRRDFSTTIRDDLRAECPLFIFGVINKHQLRKLRGPSALVGTIAAHVKLSDTATVSPVLSTPSSKRQMTTASNSPFPRLWRREGCRQKGQMCVEQLHGRFRSPDLGAARGQGVDAES